MAYDAAISSLFSARSQYQLYLYVRRDQTDKVNNRSTYAWALYGRFVGPGSNLSWVIDPQPWTVTIAGQVFSGSSGMDFRGRNEIVFGSGSTGWKSHSSDGSLTIGISTSMNAVLFGSASVSASFITDRIAKVPAAPSHLGVDQISTTSMRYRFEGNSNGGSPILEWQAQRGTNSGMTSGLVTVTSSGTTIFTGLNPATSYWFRARGRNAIGWGPWATAPYPSGTTLPATPPKLTVTPSLSGTSVTLVMAPPAGVSKVTSYVVERRTVGGALTESNTYTSSPQTVTGRTPGQSMEWRASAMIGTYQTPFSVWQLVVQPSTNTNPGDYFDGNSVDKTDINYNWIGTVNNSTSRGQGRAPTGWRTFSAGAAISGGTGVTIRTTGGFSSAFAARTTFFTDAVTAGYRGGTAMTAIGAAEASAGGEYWGSVLVQPSRSQRMAAEIIWLNGSYAPVGASAIGSGVVVPSTVSTRLSVVGTAPVGTVYAAVGWRDVTGTGWSVWTGGNFVVQDQAMITIGELYTYFDGNTPDTNLFDYTWLGSDNASQSIRTTLEQSFLNLLADPDCAPIPEAPIPPLTIDDCIVTTGTWRRYWAIVPASEISRWLAVIPTITITTATEAARQVRVRIFENPEGVEPKDFDDDMWTSEQIISYIPPNTEFVLDGISRRAWAAVGENSSVEADSLLYGTDGSPATWPLLSCGLPYLISFDVPLDAPDNNISVSVSLTRRF